ncbi:hypothetical protein ACJJIF_04255 [Microbulbifer sp. SSSA002]|uniref:hypothetical protein n=1 Tax=unclassified Microbulbifer TaxID=2619833 RepID=UPI00403A02AF
MKVYKLITLTTAICFSGAVQAIATDNIEKKEIEVNKSSTRANSAEFGIFKIEHSLIGVPTSIAAPEYTVTTKGETAIVDIGADSATDIIGKGTIVRNTITRELTTLTGNIIALLDKSADAYELTSIAGVEVLSVFPGTDIAVLKVKEGNDLLEAFNSIRQSGLVIESRVEVTETINTAQ